MSSKLHRLRALRRELERYQPQSGVAKWDRLFSAFRVAGEPRAVSALRKCVLLADVVVDERVPKEVTDLVLPILEQMKSCAAIAELALLDQQKLVEYIKDYRAKDYRLPVGRSWEQDAPRNPRPDGLAVSPKLWRLIVGEKG